MYWTPGYWAYDDGQYQWNGGYWGPQVGFYGGVNYGYGYFGNGYDGGRWNGRNFRYNTAYSNVNRSVIRNVYYSHATIDNREIVNRYGGSRISYNGGPHGIAARATTSQRQAYTQRRFAMTAQQQQHATYARQDTNLRYNVNHGKPAIAVAPRPFSRTYHPTSVPAKDRAIAAPHAAAPAAVHHAAPAAVHHAAPAAVHHAAPAAVHHAAPAAVHHAAPAAVHHAAPAVRASCGSGGRCIMRLRRPCIMRLRHVRSTTQRRHDRRITRPRRVRRITRRLLARSRTRLLGRHPRTRHPRTRHPRMRHRMHARHTGRDARGGLRRPRGAPRGLRPAPESPHRSRCGDRFSRCSVRRFAA